MSIDEMKKKEMDKIDNLIGEIVANENRTEKARDKDGLADHKFLKICADYCRKLDQELLEQVTLSKYEVSNIFEVYLKHKKINDITKNVLKKRLENYLTGAII